MPMSVRKGGQRKSCHLGCLMLIALPGRDGRLYMRLSLREVSETDGGSP